MVRVLVTGGAGYIGSHTCKALAQMVDHMIDLLERMVASPEPVLDITLVPYRPVERATAKSAGGRPDSGASL